jgi:hypothetical protein
VVRYLNQKTLKLQNKSVMCERAKLKKWQT